MSEKIDLFLTSAKKVLNLLKTREFKLIRKSIENAIDAQDEEKRELVRKIVHPTLNSILEIFEDPDFVLMIFFRLLKEMEKQLIREGADTDNPTLIYIAELECSLAFFVGQEQLEESLEEVGITEDQIEYVDLDDEELEETKQPANDPNFIRD